MPPKREERRPRVHLTISVPTEVERALEVDFELLSAPSGAHGVIATPGVEIDAAYFDAAGPGLRIVANDAVGTDNVDLEAARLRGIVVTNTPDVLTNASAELAIGLMLALLRRIAEGDRLIRRREPWRFTPEFMLGESLESKRLLVVGPGRIGTRVAELARAHGAEPLFAGRGDDLPALLMNADIVSLHTPLTPQTHHLIDAAALAAMKPAAILVNTSRGKIVDEQALVAALRSGTIAGAALDVFEFEPDVSEELLALDNVVLTPHIASATRDTRRAMLELCVDALRAVLLEGRTPPNAV
jgi:lactate dehydrogenase-like 2-hydroxyacid dehydrogenase